MEIPIKNKMLRLVTCFHKKITTWDYLQKRGWKGPRLCILCKSDLESINLFLVNVYSFRKFGLILESFYLFISVTLGTSIKLKIICFVGLENMSNIRSYPFLLFRKCGKPIITTSFRTSNLVLFMWVQNCCFIYRILQGPHY